MTFERDRALAPVHNPTRRDVVVRAIREALLSGELVPGQRIKEVHLADALGVSRPTIREAIHELIHDGTLVQEAYKGVRVASLGPQDLLDVAEVRVSLETLAALQLAKHPDEARMTRLHEIHQEHLEAVKAGDAVQADATHLALHRALWEGADNGLVMRIWPLVESRIRIAMALDQAAWSDPERDAKLHVSLIDAIASGDEEQIATEMREHIRASADHVIALLEETNQD